MPTSSDSVAPRRVEEAGVEEDHVAGAEFELHRRVDEGLVLLEVRAQEELGVEATGIEQPVVGPGDHLQGPVVLPLLAEGEPHAHELRSVEAPVADVLVPERLARVARELGHDAVVVRLRDAHGATEERLEAPAQLRGRGELPEHAVPGHGVQEPARRLAAGGRAIRRRAGIVDVRLVLGRTEERIEGRLGDGAHARDGVGVGEAADDEVTVAVEALPVEFADRISRARGKGAHEDLL